MALTRPLTLLLLLTAFARGQSPSPSAFSLWPIDLRIEGSITVCGGMAFDDENRPPASNDSNARRIAGPSATHLNLIPGARVLTGYHDERDRPNLLNALKADPLLVGVGIPANASIVLTGRKIRVYGSGKATFILHGNDRQPHRVQHVPTAKKKGRNDPYKTIVDLTAWRRDAIERQQAVFPAETPPKPCVKNGTLIIIGGGKTPEGLMQRMVDLAGGEKAHLLYIPCLEQDEANETYSIIQQWEVLGVASTAVFHTKDRMVANSDEAFLAPLKKATGIWFGGGRQWNLADSYYGTAAHRLMLAVIHRGGVIAGSSAGASIQADYMARGNPVANYDIMAPGYERGLGFLTGVAIDQHFSQRKRQKDMTQLVDRYPQLLGMGIDESTALIVQKSQAEIVGAGKVYFYDRTQPVREGHPDYLALGTGEGFDLAERRVRTGE